VASQVSAKKNSPRFCHSAFSQSPKKITEYTFTDTVKKLQERYGSRSDYAQMENSGKRYILTEQETEIIESRDGFYLSTVNHNGWPYAQYRGGPRGFLKQLDSKTLGFADFQGNRQLVSSGNILDGGKTILFLMNYPSRTRLKIWAKAKLEFAENNPELAQQLTIPKYQGKVQRLITLGIQAFDWNCSQHIILRCSVEEIRANNETVFF
jgi:uncharacterized protein